MLLVSSKNILPVSDASLIFLSPLCAGTFPGRNGLIAYDRGGEVWVVNPNGSDPHKIADGRDPAFSPDGRWIVFIDERNNDPDLFVIRPDGTDERQITNKSNDNLIRRLFNPADKPSLFHLILRLSPYT